MKKMNNSVSELSQQAFYVRLHFENIKRKGVIYMKKIKNTQKVALILLFATLFALLAGCTAPANPTETDPALFSGLTEFVAVPFADCGFLSWQYSLEVKVIDNEIYLNDLLYREISDNKFDITNMDSFFLCHIEGVEILNFLEKLENSEMLCLLGTESQSSIGQQIAIYDIDGAYYFLSFYDDCEIVRIHYKEYMTGG